MDNLLAGIFTSFVLKEGQKYQRLSSAASPRFRHLVQDSGDVVHPSDNLSTHSNLPPKTGQL
jgi:hypothetical protein